MICGGEAKCSNNWIFIDIKVIVKLLREEIFRRYFTMVQNKINKNALKEMANVVLWTNGEIAFQDIKVLEEQCVCVLLGFELRASHLVGSHSTT
jgi:hypothetical protein